MSSQGKSLYDILGVNKSDSCSEIKKTYLKLARTHHPDKGGDQEHFKEIQRASEILTDEKKRNLYDELGVIDGENGVSTESPFAGNGTGVPFPFEVNLNDLFGSMFGNPSMGINRGAVRKNKKPSPTVQTVNITLEQYYNGYNFDVNINRSSFCNSCEHTGAKSKETCKICSGRGTVTRIVQMGPMAMQTTGPCIDCQGKGERILEKCGKCNGTGFLEDKRSLAVKVLPGTRPGETYIFPEVCSDNPLFEKPGDVHIIIAEDSNDVAFKTFKRSGDKLQNLETSVVISLAESLIGCVLQINGHPGYKDGLHIKIPPGSFNGDKYCLSGYGMAVPGSIGKYGDLFITISVNIKPSERKLFTTKGYEVLVPIFKDNVRPSEHLGDSVNSDLYLCSV